MMKKVLQLLNGQPRSLHMDHAVTVRAKQRKVFKPGFATRHKRVDRFDVMRFDETRTPRTIGCFEIERTCFAF
jgi:hypothetical protein